MTGDNKQKTKASMLQELESIKALLLEEDDIPLLQPSDDIPILVHEDEIPVLHQSHYEIPTLTNDEDIPVLKDTLSVESTRPTKLTQADFFTPPHREPLAKGTGENPFLPQHIRARLHGNNPFPSFETEAAQRIAKVNQPVRSTSSDTHAHQSRNQLIQELIDKILPELHNELRLKLENLTREQLEELLKD